VRHAVPFPFTLAALILAGSVLAMVLTTDFGVVDLRLDVERISGTEFDELVISWAVVIVALGVDLAKRASRRADRLQAEQLRVVHVTMRTVQDVVGNCLTELQLLRMHADGVVPPEALAIFDESIRVTSAKLQGIEQLKSFAEKEMAVGSGLDTEVGRKATTKPGA
jgi:hypothetical protein